MSNLVIALRQEIPRVGKDGDATHQHTCGRPRSLDLSTSRRRPSSDPAQPLPPLCPLLVSAPPYLARLLNWRTPTGDSHHPPSCQPPIRHALGLLLPQALHPWMSEYLPGRFQRRQLRLVVQCASPLLLPAAALIPRLASPCRALTASYCVSGAREVGRSCESPSPPPSLGVASRWPRVGQQEAQLLWLTRAHPPCPPCPPHTGWIRGRRCKAPPHRRPCSKRDTRASPAISPARASHRLTSALIRISTPRMRTSSSPTPSPSSPTLPGLVPGRLARLPAWSRHWPPPSPEATLRPPSR